MKRKLPLIVLVLVYAAFVAADLVGRWYKPSHLFLYPLAALAWFVIVLVGVHFIVSLFIRPWREQELNWIIISIDIIIAGILAVHEVI